jgi:subtilisin family serine protease
VRTSIRPWKALVALGLVLAAVVLAPQDRPGAGAAGSGDIAPQQVRDLVAREGSARVIVELETPGTVFRPEGFLQSLARLAQRQEIARAQGRVLSRLRAFAHRELRRYSTVPLMALEVDAAALSELEASGLVKRIYEDIPRQTTLAQSVPLVEGDQAWAAGFDGTGTVIAIIDTGVSSSHPFLAGKVVEEACYSSTVANQSTTVCPNGGQSQTGAGSARPCSISSECNHGTHVAGIAAGNGVQAGQSFSGVARGAQIMAVQVFSRFTSGCGIALACAQAWDSDIIEGLERVYALRGTRNIVAVNMSLGGDAFSGFCDGEPHKPIIDNLRSAGIATIAASGNNGSASSIISPACISSAISVGSTTKSDQISSFSNVAAFLSLFAPGESITSSVPSTSYGVLSGTSMSAPHVAGGWAVLKHAFPGATVDQVLAALQETGRPTTDTRTGVTRPRIRIAQALNALDPDALAVTAVSPNEAAPGASLDVAVSGANFADGATASFGAEVTVNEVVFETDSLLTVKITVAANAALGPRDVRITNPDAKSAAIAQGFAVRVPGQIIIDNGQPGTSSTGNWCNSGASGSYGPTSLYSCGSFSSETYRWTPTIPAQAQYDVYIWWTSGSNRGTAVPFRVRHASGITTRTFNERSGGGQWVLHGRYTLSAGTTSYAETDDSAGQAAADAVMFLPVAPPTPDTTPPDTSITAGPTGTIGQNSASFTWTGTDAVTPTAELVYASRLEGLEATFTAYSNATTRNFTGLANGSYTLHVRARDLEDNEDPTPATRSFTVNVTAPPAGEIVIDNGAAGTTFSGNWCASAGASPFGPGSLYSCGSFTRDTYRWRPTIPATRAYDVYVWWTTGANRATSAPFSVVHQGGTTTRTFNERTGGGQWVLHGRYTFSAGTAGYVETSDVNGQACADAVRFVPAP